MAGVRIHSDTAESVRESHAICKFPCCAVMFAAAQCTVPTGVDARLPLQHWKPTVPKIMQTERGNAFACNGSYTFRPRRISKEFTRQLQVPLLQSQGCCCTMHSAACSACPAASATLGTNGSKESAHGTWERIRKQRFAYIRTP